MTFAEVLIFFLLSVADREDFSARGESNGNNDSLQAC